MKWIVFTLILSYGHLQAKKKEQKIMPVLSFVAAYSLLLRLRSVKIKQ
jgi:hypothetical protein